MTTPLRTATPKSAMKPTPAEMLKGMPRSSSANTPPTAASGTPVNTSSACLTEPNVVKSSRKIRRSDSGTTISRRARARSRFSNWPAELDAVAGGQRHDLSLEEAADVVDEPGDVAPAHVALDQDQARAVDVADLRRALDLFDPGQ